MIKVLILNLFKKPKFFTYLIYDLCIYIALKRYKEFFGWGVHLYTGRFGTGKSNAMCAFAYKQCLKYPQLHVLTNLNLINFPKHTHILSLNTAQDILNAPANTLVLIDEIGTIFNSRDFSSGKTAVPKTLFQHLCQCRKRNMMILGTVQKYNLLDKQIRDISADVTVCKGSLKHPFTRYIKCYTYDVDEYDMYMSNRVYNPKLLRGSTYIQKNLYRNLYDTGQLIDNMLQKDYLNDDEILTNRGETPPNNYPLKRKEQVKFKRRKVL